ncbi:hypothetical protein PIB30_041972 [Stylosanthes scabra]|uniref:rRNA N-glycosidase n=1 Tax=Stylosanthes scabra TaxID=79078 RepID=A0ABU6WFF8_9FABA|nr:hypothetical protein [Stylosanthes scabra]
MPRVKQTGRRTRADPNALPMPPRLSQLPEERWFEDNNERLAFWKFFHLSSLGMGYFRTRSTRSFGDSLTSKACAYSSTCVRAAYTTLYIQDDLNDEGNGRFVLGFRLGGRSYEFSLTTLVNIWGLKDEGVTFKGGNNPHGTWNEFNKLDAIRGLRLEHAAPGKYAISRMSTDQRLLLYVLSYVLLPRKSNHGSASEEDLLILWAMVQEKQIHWPYLMAYKMLRYSQGKPTSFLALVHLWTRIFEIAPLDLTREEDVEPEISHAISSKNIHQMWRNLVDHVGVAEDAGVDAMADAQPRVETDAPAQIPTETGVPPQFYPDIAEFGRKGLRTCGR